MIGGMKPWEDSAYFYSLMAISLSVMVPATLSASSGAADGSSRGRPASNIFHGMVTITRRNTRRYGGYLVHFGVVLIIIGFAGLPFNQDKEQEMGFGDKMQIGRLHAGVPVVHAGRQAELLQRVGGHRCVQARQADRHHVSRAPLLQGQRADGDHGGQSLAPE